MCMSTPKIPTPAVLQDMKQPDTGALLDKARRNRMGMGMPSLLTGPSGVANTPTARSTLLGQ